MMDRILDKVSKRTKKVVYKVANTLLRTTLISIAEAIYLVDSLKFEDLKSILLKSNLGISKEIILRFKDGFSSAVLRRTAELQPYEMRIMAIENGQYIRYINDRDEGVKKLDEIYRPQFHGLGVVFKTIKYYKSEEEEMNALRFSDDEIGSWLVEENEDENEEDNTDYDALDEE